MTPTGSGQLRRRVFVWFAIALFVPVLALAVVLTSVYRSDALERTLTSGRDQARLLAQTSVEPVIAGQDLAAGLSVGAMADLGAAVERAVEDGQIALLRLRAVDGRVVFPPDDRTPDDPATDAAVAAAASGRALADLRAVAQPVEGGPARVVQVWSPVVAPSDTQDVLGVLEVYLPHDNVAAAIDRRTGQFLALLGGGMLALWGVAAALAFVVTRRMHEQVERNEHLAHHDPLTGLPNRAFFTLRARRAIAEATREQTTCAVAIVDLDRFKEVNDTLGHHVGDELLKIVARRLSDLTRTDDTVARLGGDEFGVLLPHTSAEGALRVVTALADGLDADVEVEGLQLPLRGSVGVAVHPDDGTALDMLLRGADAAMYRSKRAGRPVLASETDWSTGEVADLTLFSELRRAVREQQLVVHYQPQVRMDDGTVSGVEALVRWEHPDQGLLPPGVFLPLAERTGLVHDIDAVVLRQGVEQWCRWRADGLEPELAVNVSASTLQRTSFPAMVGRLLEETGMPAERLVLEMTETAVIDQLDTIEQALRDLADLGCRLSMDDFGRGSTSLSYLDRLPLSELKIDRSFVSEMLTNEMCHAIVSTTVGLAHRAGMRTVGEGIEDEATWDALHAMGCDVGQGYGIARPLPPADAATWLARGGALGRAA